MKTVHHRSFLLPCSLCLPALIAALTIGCSGPVVTVVERVEYQLPEGSVSGSDVDDALNKKTAPAFVPARVHPRLSNEKFINLSSSVTKLELSALKPDLDQDLLELHTNFRDALERVESVGVPILPSVDLIDVKSRQFDAGLIAALEEYWYLGESDATPGDLGFLERLAAALPADSRAAAYFAAGLNLAGIAIPATNEAAKDHFADRYFSEVAPSELAGIYLWSETLQQCYRVGRYFQMEFDLDENDWMQPVVLALQSNPGLAADYRQILTRWSRVSSAPSRLTILDLLDSAGAVALVRLRRERGITSSAISLFPPRSHREFELARRLFPMGYSADGDVLDAMIRSIHQGLVDVRPTEGSGWCDYQAYALETLLVPQRGDEARSLLLSDRYLRRRLEIFQATMTKSEVIQSQSEDLIASDVVNLVTDTSLVSPRLRLEPAPTYYIRMARSYRFLGATLRELIAEPQLSRLYGLTAGGRRSLPLIQELQELQRLFYGCYALSAQDLGMELFLDEIEQEELEDSLRVAQTWMDQLTQDPDLAVDARTIIPVANNSRSQVTSALATLGVRICRIRANYLHPAVPQVKFSETGDWIPVDTPQLGEATYLIAVDDQISVKIPRNHVLTHTEFQKLCDELVEREKVIRRLQL